MRTAQHDMWWRVCSLLAWFPLQGKDLELMFSSAQIDLMFCQIYESQLHSQQSTTEDNPGKFANTFQVMPKLYI